MLYLGVTLRQEAYVVSVRYITTRNICCICEIYCDKISMLYLWNTLRQESMLCRSVTLRQESMLCLSVTFRQETYAVSVRYTVTRNVCCICEIHYDKNLCCVWAIHNGKDYCVRIIVLQIQGSLYLWDTLWQETYVISVRYALTRILSCISARYITTRNICCICEIHCDWRR